MYDSKSFIKIQKLLVHGSVKNITCFLAIESFDSDCLFGKSYMKIDK